jgi:hypothetical protein
MSAQSVKALADKRVRRQKIFIAVGSVVLLAVLGFELPKVMGHKNGVSAAPAITAATPGVGTPAVPVVPAGKLPNTDRVAVVRDTNQLISFGLFKSKDPFVQQISASAAPSTSAAPKPPPAPVAKPTPIPAPPLVPPGLVPPAAPPATPPAPGATPAPTATTPAPVPAVPTDALIATNGVCERIAPDGTFPNNENIFRLVSIARNGKSVEIGIVGGSFDSGKPTATLKLGDKLTLVNTADGTRYVIALKASCAAVAPSGSSTTSSPSTPTTPVAPPASPPATTPTTTTTTTTTTVPIVTDSLDTTTTNPFG